MIDVVSKEKMVCKHCQKENWVVIKECACNLDDKRETPVFCSYCSQLLTNVRVTGRQEADSEKVD